MAFEAKLEHAAIMKKLMDSVKELATEANFDCSSSGMQLQAMDQSHVSLVALTLKSEGFESYTCERNISLGVVIESMCKILKCAGNDDKLTIRADEERDKIHFVFDNKKQEKVSEFELKLTDIDGEHLVVQDSEYSVECTISSAEYHRTCRDLSMLGEACTISVVSKESIKFSATGEIGSGSITIKRRASTKDVDRVSIEFKEAVTQTYALKYLNLFARASSLSPTVKLSMATGIPLAVEFSLEDMGHVRFYLAPKIDDETAS